MVLMIASDIHGSAYWCRKLVGAFEKEGAERLLLLGDILYHGPRNALPKEYNPQNVVEMLNKLKEKIICVRGNCEAEVDQMLLKFPVMADYAAMVLNGNTTIYATHGHVYNETNPLPFSEGAILACGHTHVPKCEKHDGFVYINPGSVSIPKEDSHHGYIIYRDGAFQWKDFLGNVIMEY